MIMVRELSNEEIEEIENAHTTYAVQCTGFFEGVLDTKAFARALFEAARVQQTQERKDG